jgi:hypothetical protein
MSRMRDVESLEAVAQLVDQMSTVLSPTLLLQLTLKVSPEGRLRKRSILGMEERLLAHVITSPDGTPTWQQY